MKLIDKIEHIVTLPKGMIVLSMRDSKWGVILSTNKGGYLLDKKTHKLKKLEV